MKLTLLEYELQEELSDVRIELVSRQLLAVALLNPKPIVRRWAGLVWHTSRGGWAG